MDKGDVFVITMYIYKYIQLVQLAIDQCECYLDKYHFGHFIKTNMTFTQDRIKPETFVSWSHTPTENDKS